MSQKYFGGNPGQPSVPQEPELLALWGSERLPTPEVLLPALFGAPNRESLSKQRPHACLETVCC